MSQTMMIAYIVVLIGVFYFVGIAPQKKEKKKKLVKKKIAKVDPVPCGSIEAVEVSHGGWSLLWTLPPTAPPS